MHVLIYKTTGAKIQMTNAEVTQPSETEEDVQFCAYQTTNLAIQAYNIQIQTNWFKPVYIVHSIFSK